MECGTGTDIIKKYLDGKASDEEINQLDKWYNSFESQTDFYTASSLQLNQLVLKSYQSLS